MTDNYDALVIGAGPAGAASAIVLAKAGWRIALVEQNAYPRRKVCGECIGAGNLMLLDALGVGRAVRQAAGAELRRVAWANQATTVIADLPACHNGPYPYGRALGRDRLDAILLERARAVGVEIVQPAKLTAVRGAAGHFDCDIELRSPDARAETAFPHGAPTRAVHAAVVIDAHGSWENALAVEIGAAADRPHRQSDLLAFKANFRDTTLAPDLLPVLAFAGGYGGMVVADNKRTTLACCVRRDALRAWRRLAPGVSAGTVVEMYLRRACRIVAETLQSTKREGEWLAIGPIRPGIRVAPRHGLFAVGNAAGESHPIIGEGIGMALQSAAQLTQRLLVYSPRSIDAQRAAMLQREYAADWRSKFAPRIRMAAAYAHIAMRPTLSMVASALLQRCPALLTGAARLAGKAQRSMDSTLLTEEIA